MMLFRALGEPVPEYAHHSLIHGADGGKLSKRHGATSIGEFRDMGYLDSAVVNYLALLSWHPTDEREKLTLDEIVDEFDISRVSRSPAIFDIDKLNWLNGLYIRELPVAELAERVRPYLHEEGMEFAPVQREIVAAAIQAKLVVLEEAPRYAQVFVDEFDLADTPYYDVLAQEWRRRRVRDAGRASSRERARSTWTSNRRATCCARWRSRAKSGASRAS